MRGILLPIHIAAGMLAIGLGALALSVRKGGNLHRRSGLVFVYVMLVMGASAAILAFPKEPGNVYAAIMTVYFVGTALTTVRPVTPWTRRVNVAGLIVATGLAVLDILGGVQALRSPSGALNGVPFFMLFFLAAIMSLAAIGDLRVMRSGVPHGRKRLSRHLWRMCFALFIAAGSFFSIRARVARILPDPFTTTPMRMVAMLLPFAAMFYWLWRMRIRRALPVITRHDFTLEK